MVHFNIQEIKSLEVLKSEACHYTRHVSPRDYMTNQSNPFILILYLNKSSGSMPSVHSRVRVGNSFTWVGAGLSGVKLQLWSFKTSALT